MKKNLELSWSIWRMMRSLSLPIARRLRAVFGFTRTTGRRIISIDRPTDLVGTTCGAVCRNCELVVGLTSMCRSIFQKSASGGTLRRRLGLTFVASRRPSVSSTRSSRGQKTMRSWPRLCAVQGCAATLSRHRRRLTTSILTGYRRRGRQRVQTSESARPSLVVEHLGAMAAQTLCEASVSYAIRNNLGMVDDSVAAALGAQKDALKERVASARKRELGGSEAAPVRRELEEVEGLNARLVERGCPGKITVQQ